MCFFFSIFCIMFILQNVLHFYHPSFSKCQKIWLKKFLGIKVRQEWYKNYLFSKYFELTFHQKLLNFLIWQFLKEKIILHSFKLSSTLIHVERKILKFRDFKTRSQKSYYNIIEKGSSHKNQFKKEMCQCNTKLLLCFCVHKLE